MRKLLALLFFTITLGMAQGANAGPYEVGMDWYNRGDYATALSMWRPLAAQGHADAQNNLGRMYRKGQGVSSNSQEAVKWWRLAAAQGVAEAQNNLGFMYESGTGVAQDLKEAEKWYRLAAAQGVTEAQIFLGVMYENGQGVVRDYVQAQMWYLLSAANGSHDGTKARNIIANKMTAAQIAQAQEMAHRCQVSSYKQCNGVVQDHIEAVKWYQIKADQHDPWAENFLGFMYANGLGVVQDHREAVKWYRVAANNNGHAPAQNNLGYMYENGLGAVQDYVRAHMWFNESAANGYFDASKNRDAVAKRMTAAQIAQAQEMTHSGCGRFKLCD